MRCALWLVIAIAWPAVSARAQQEEPKFLEDNAGENRSEIDSEPVAPLHRFPGSPPRRGQRANRLREQIAETEPSAFRRTSSPSFDEPTASARNEGSSGFAPPQSEELGTAPADAERAVTPPPLRRAYQAPDIFRTPNPTPLEGAPHAPGVYSPRVVPDYSQVPSVPQAPPEPPMPPLAPLVNIRFADTWLPAARDDLGMNDFDVRGTLAMGRTGVFVTPGYGMHFLNGPVRTDLPATLYDAYIDVRWNKKLNDQWAFELAWTPSFYSDLDNTSSDAWRFITTVIGFYQISPETQWMAGVMYLDRFDINWFPVFGFIYAEPESDWRWEVVFPRPKFSRRVLRGEDKDSWIYLAGEFGGGAWAVQRANGADDMIAYRDWRVTLGYETKVKDYSALSWFGEVGFVFNRQLEYESGRGDFNPSAAGMLRLGVSY